jgi:hypothetical protein
MCFRQAEVIEHATPLLPTNNIRHHLLQHSHVIVTIAGDSSCLVVWWRSRGVDWEEKSGKVVNLLLRLIVRGNLKSIIR